MEVFLVYTPQRNRPLLTQLPFIARDLPAWGYRVDRHLLTSAYITEIRKRERWFNQGKRGSCNATEWTTDVMELWACEVMTRQFEALPPTVSDELSLLDRRLERVSCFVRDFVYGIAAYDKPRTIRLRRPIDRRPVSSTPRVSVAKCMALLRVAKYTSTAALPAWTLPGVVIADQVTFEFRYHEGLLRDHLEHALQNAQPKGAGRMGRVEKRLDTGSTVVVLVVDVGDLVMASSVELDPETRDPVPVYERVEHPPPYREA